MITRQDEINSSCRKKMNEMFQCRPRKVKWLSGLKVDNQDSCSSGAEGRLHDQELFWIKSKLKATLVNIARHSFKTKNKTKQKKKKGNRAYGRTNPSI